MCVEKNSVCAMGAESHAKLMNSSEAVGLLAALTDSGSVTLLAFGKQELWRHALAARTMSTPNQLVVDDATPESPEQLTDTGPQVPSISCPDEKAPRASVKKVRFAPDVVEPSGDSRAYRGKANGSKVTQRKACVDTQDLKEKCENHEVNMRTPLVESECKNRRVRTLARPNLPANRMLLYQGKQCHRPITTIRRSVIRA